MPAERERERDLLACGERLQLQLVASTAAHFAMPDDYATYRVASAVRQNTLLDQLPPTLADHAAASSRVAGRTASPFRRPARRRRQYRPSRRRCSTTRCCRASASCRRRACRANSTRPTFLRKLCERGLRERDLGANPAAQQRLREELAIIDAEQLATYFLTVRDIARYARHKGHSMALRGSAGNSLVCYLLYITDVDPLRFRLPFERFLYQGRPDLPDIDLDFDWKVRDDVIAHVIQRYGAAHTARISSHLFLQPKSAFREAGKIHGLSNEQISNLLTKLPERVDDTSSCRKRRRRFRSNRERWPRIVADARRLLGRPHHLSLHPGGVVITPGPIEDHVPLKWPRKASS